MAERAGIRYHRSQGARTVAFNSVVMAERVRIRTHGDPEDHNGFRDRPIQPLWHLSECQNYNRKRLNFHGFLQDWIFHRADAFILQFLLEDGCHFRLAVDQEYFLGFP